ncbi:MAG: ribonuclease P/MRP protein subunit RPP1 [Haloarculaceae archaeon]|jgi:ribonuclease P/MRP protein subunit RPP1
MYEGIHAHPDGTSTVARMALTASEHGYDGIVVRNHGDSPSSYDPEGISETYGVDVVTGVEVRASDPSRASGFVGNHRADKTVVAVHGGDPEINRFAVEQPAVDVLAHPMREEGDFNHVLAREAAENGVRVELSLRRILHQGGGQRVRAIRDLRKLWEILDHYDAPFVVSADPESHLGVRSPRDLEALGDVVGIDPEKVAGGLREWGRLAERNRDRHSDAFVEPGVWRGRRPGDDGGESDDERPGA